MSITFSKFFSWILCIFLFIEHVRAQPSPVSSITLVKVESSSIEFTWDIVSDAVSYVIVVDINSNANSITNCNPGVTVSDPPFRATLTRTSATIQARTTYVLGVCSVNGAGESAPTLKNSVTTGPLPVNNVNATAHVTGTSSNLLIQWQDPDSSTTLPVTQYRIAYGIASTGVLNETVLLNRTDPPPTSVILVDLLSNSNYSVTVTSLTTDSDVTSDVTSSVVGITLPKPLKLQGSQSSTSTITIEWEGSQEGSISTTVTASWNPPSTGGLSTLTGITGDQTIISELQLNTRYHVSLYCVNIQGSSLPTSSNYYTIPGRANVPRKEYASGGAIKLHWDKFDSGSASVTYYVEWDPPDLNGNNNMSGITDSEVEVGDLRGNEWHTFKVRAVNGGGMGEYSEELRSRSTPSVPGSLVVDMTTNDGRENAVISWSPPNDTTDDVIVYALRWWHYYVGNFTSEHEEFPAVSGKTRYEHTVYDLLPGQRYDVSVVAISSVGGSPPVSDFIWTTPESPENLRVDDVADTIVTIDWDLPEYGAVGYKSFYSQGNDVTLSGYARNPPYDVQSLVPNSQYSLFISAYSGPRDDLIESAVSNAINVTTAPASPGNLVVEYGADNHTEIVITFSLSEHGADLYQVSVRSSSKKFSENTTSSSATRSGLVPGDEYDVSVVAFASGGASRPNSRPFIMVPDAVKNFVVSPNKGNPSQQLEARWESPDGVGDLIQIDVSSTTGNFTGSTAVRFFFTAATLDVVPGHNYSIAATVYSETTFGISQLTEATSRPAPPTDVKAKITSDGVLVSWSKPEGYVQSFVIEVTNSNKTVIQEATLPGDAVEHTFTSLSNLTGLDVHVFSSVVTVDGIAERSALEGSEQSDEKEDPDFFDKNYLYFIIGGLVAAALIVALAGSVFLYRRRYKSKKDADDVYGDDKYGIYGNYQSNEDTDDRKNNDYKSNYPAQGEQYHTQYEGDGQPYDNRSVNDSDFESVE